jgi:hypothetical protein
MFVRTSYSSCLLVKDHPGCCQITFIFDDDNEYWLLQKGGRWDVGVYDYENDTVSDIVSPDHGLIGPVPFESLQTLKKMPKKVQIFHLSS